MIKSTRQLSRAILAWFIFSLTMPLWAADEESANISGDSLAAEQEATSTLDEIVVTGKKQFWKNVSEGSTKMAQPLVETPQAITIIDGEFLASIEAQNYFDAVRYVSGVNLQGHARLVRTTISSRGFSLDPHRGYKINGNNLIQRTAPDMVTIDRLELIKGANAIAFGQNPPGGFVNLITKKPTEELQGYASLLVGDYDRMRAEVDYGGPVNSSGSVRLRGVASYEQSEVFQEFQENDGIAGGLFLDIDLTDKDLISLNMIYQDKSGTPHFGLALFPDGTVPEVSNEFAPMQPWSKVDYSFLNVQAVYEHLFDNGMKLSLLLNKQQTDVDSRSGTPCCAPVPLADEFDPVTGDITRRRGDTGILATAVIEETDSEAAEIRFGGDFELWGREHSLLITAEYMNQFFPRRENEFFLLNADGTPFIFNYFDPTYDSIEPTFVRTDETGFDQTSYSTSAQVVARPFDRVQITAGFRYDKIEEDLLVTSTAAPAWDDNHVSPRIALMYGITDSINVYYSYSESFSPNGELDCNNSLLPPKIGEQNEIGLKAEFLNKALLLTVAAFDIDQTNLTTGDTCGGAGIQRSRIAGEANHSGFEMELVGLIRPNWNIIASISSIDADLVDGPSPEQLNVGVANVPENSYSFYSNYEVTSGALEGFGFGIGVTYESSKKPAIPAANDLPAYTQWDAQIVYSKLDPVTLIVSGINITDEVGYDATFAFLGIGNTRRPPRQLSFRATYDF